MPRPTLIRVERHFSHRFEDAYAWLTDFDESDAQRAGAVVATRQVVERSAQRVVYKGETEALGRRSWGTTEVRLRPPDAWEARVTEGPRTGSWTTYRLSREGEACRLLVEYRFVFTSPLRHWAVKLLRGALRRELERMWDGYARSMDEELRAER